MGSRVIAMVLCAAGCGRFGFGAVAGSGDGDGHRADASFTTRHWANRNDGAPGKLLSPRLAYDDARGTVVLYGGDAVVESAAMWELRSTGWALLCDPCAPGPRFVHGLAYDPDRDRLVLIGGDDGGVVYNDTWEWDGSTWTNITTARPGLRDLVGMTWDRSSHRLVAVGGVVGVTPTDDLLVYNGVMWAALAAANGPGHVAGYGQLLAPTDAGLIVLPDDGDPAGNVMRDDLWSLAGTTWTAICSACSGTPRNSASIVFDEALGVTWMVGGYDGSSIAGTWKLVGTSWVMTDALPPARDSVGLAYDRARDVIVLYGGNGDSCAGTNCNDTWELVPN
jgi:hypothetical protein